MKSKDKLHFNVSATVSTGARSVATEKSQKIGSRYPRKCNRCGNEGYDKNECPDFKCFTCD